MRPLSYKDLTRALFCVESAGLPSIFISFSAYAAVVDASIRCDNRYRGRLFALRPGLEPAPSQDDHFRRDILMNPSLAVSTVPVPSLGVHFVMISNRHLSLAVFFCGQNSAPCAAPPLNSTYQITLSSPQENDLNTRGMLPLDRRHQIAQARRHTELLPTRELARRSYARCSPARNFLVAALPLPAAFKQPWVTVPVGGIFWAYHMNNHDPVASFDADIVMEMNSSPLRFHSGCTVRRRTLTPTGPAMHLLGFSRTSAPAYRDTILFLGA